MKLDKTVLVALAIAILSTAALAQGTRPEPGPLSVAGIITAIDATQRMVTLNGPLPGGAAGQARRPVVFACNDDTRIVKNGQEAGFDALALQDECQAMCKRTENGLVALRVTAKTPGPRLAWANGVIVAVDPAASTFDLQLPPRPDAPGPVVLKFAVDAESKIMKNGAPATLEDLKPQDRAAVGFVPSPELGASVGPIRASVVEAKTPIEVAHIVGTLVEITDQGVIVVARPEAANASFQLTSQTKIVKLHEVGPQALLPGDIVDVAYNKASDAAIPPAIGVHVQPFPFRGIMLAVNLENQTVAIQETPTAPARLFKVVRETVIKKNGAPAPLDALKPKDIAEVRFFHFRDVDVAGGIMARSPRPAPR